MKIQLTILLILGLLSSSAMADYRLTSAMESASQKHNLPGIGIAVLKNGKMVLKETVGVKEIGKMDRLEGNDLFHLGSLTKSMTAILIAKLVDQGRIKYSSKVSELLPGINFHKDYKNTTIESLLLHRSGLARGITQFGKIQGALNAAKTIIQAREIVVKNVFSIPPSYIPHSKEQYSNTGYLVLGHIIEKMWGRSYEDLIQRELFLSLNIRNCTFSTKNSGGHIVSRGTVISHFEENLKIWAPAGNARCTLDEWGKFAQLQLDLINGKSSFISKATARRLFEKQGVSSMNYTLGALYIDQREWVGEEAFTHTGTNLVNYSRVWILPKSNKVILLSTNRGGDESFSGEDASLKEANDTLNNLAELIIKNY